MLPIGLRNANPGNLRASVPPWNGTIGTNGGFVVFDSMVSGIRALAKQLLAYQDRRGYNTVRQVITTWAPDSENDTDAYIHAVCAVLDCEPDDEFDFHDESFLYWMVSAIGEHENGAPFHQNVDDATIEAGVRAALA